MAGFQTQVEPYREIGIPGQVSTDNEVIYLPGTPLAQDGAGDLQVRVGYFVWYGTADANNLRMQPIGTGLPAGFVTRVQKYYNFAVGSEASQEVPENSELEVARKGDFFAMANTVSTVGQAVFASNLTVDIATGAVGATIANYTETPFLVTRGGAATDVIEISNWSI